jgi:hypothetical protein
MLIDQLKSKSVNQSLYDVLPHDYGGPLVLKEYKFFIYLPYQFSTMKMYENMNNGVVVAIPTKKYYKEIIT